ncbi:hypothetical protein C8Q79DRAFT_927430 [Trametes meyenii]|nr:hypothetical protein C8Q79DRAFT_927430 [Trametes meyenii]
MRLEEIASLKSEAAMHRVFTRAFNESNIAPEMRACTTFDDCTVVSGLYLNTGFPKQNSTRWDTLELPIHVFKHECDPFAPEDMLTEVGRENREEISMYAVNAFTRQQRTHLFSVVIFGGFLRLIRMDRLTVVVSNPPIPYLSNTEIIPTFFMRFASLSPEERGHDRTAMLVAPGTSSHSTMLAAAATQLQGAADHARKAYAETLADTTWPFWKLSVASFSEAKPAREFLVGKPVFSGNALQDRRGGRGYVALEIDASGDAKFVFLKDSWRWLRPEMEAEGTSLELLNARRVRYVPTLLCHEDIPGHRIDMNKALANIYGPSEALDALPSVIFSHYRMVVREVGVPLHKFSSGRQLIEILTQCVEAHRDAYKLTNILHRDISDGNILMVPVDGTKEPGTVVYQGMLMDWELCERVDLRDIQGYDQPSRRGTYSYLSVRAMDYPRKFVGVADEIEAFVHVLVQMAVDYLPTDCSFPADLEAFKDAYFEVVRRKDDTRTTETCSELKRRCIREGELLTDEGKLLSFVLPEDPHTCNGRFMRAHRSHPIDYILRTVLAWIQARYAALPEYAARKASSTPTKGPLTAHEAKQNRDEDGAPHHQKTRSPAKSPRHGRSPLKPADINRPDPAGWSDTDDENTDETISLLAQMLDTHNAFLGLLSSSLARPNWPASDKLNTGVGRNDGESSSQDDSGEDNSADSGSSDSEELSSDSEEDIRPTTKRERESPDDDSESDSEVTRSVKRRRGPQS